MRVGLGFSLFGLLLTGLVPGVGRCQNGGGWIPGAKGGKATFGFQVSKDGTGQFTYEDHNSVDPVYFPNGVNIHGTILSSGVNNRVITVDGTYTAQQGGTSGYFEAILFDTGANGAFKGDTVQITLSPDPSLSPVIYFNSGTLGDGGPGGGNIKAGASPAALLVFVLLTGGWMIVQRRRRPARQGIRD
jgi:hypothetical protein